MFCLPSLFLFVVSVCMYVAAYVRASKWGWSSINQALHVLPRSDSPDRFTARRLIIFMTHVINSFIETSFSFDTTWIKISSYSAFKSHGKRTVCQLLIMIICQICIGSIAHSFNYITLLSNKIKFMYRKSIRILEFISFTYIQSH